MIIVTINCQIHVSDDFFLFYTEKWSIFQYFHSEIHNSMQNNGEKMIGHPTRFRENDDLPLWRGPAVNKQPPFFFNARALITCEIMRSRDAQRNTGDSGSISSRCSRNYKGSRIRISD